MSVPDKPRPSGALAAIDLLRFAAAVLVMLYHYFGAFALIPRESAGGLPALTTNPWIVSGWVGVEIFFVISGYVIAMSAANSSAADFVRRRSLRLYPAAIICATITASVLWIGDFSIDNLGLRWLLSALLIPAELEIDPVYWTLIAECGFYGLVAILLVLGRWNPVKLGVSLSIWTLAFLLLLPPTGERQSAMSLLGILLLMRFGAFFGLGVLIRSLHTKDKALKAWHFIPALIAIPLVINSDLIKLGRDTAVPAMLTFAASLCVIGFAPQLQKRLQGQGIAKLSVALGLATYPLYLVHQYVGEAMMIALHGQGIPVWISVGPTMAAMVGLALLITQRAELSLRKLMQSLFDKWVSRPRATTA